MDYTKEVIPEWYHMMDGVNFHVVNYDGEKYVYRMIGARGDEDIAWIMGQNAFNAVITYLATKGGYKTAVNIKSYFDLPVTIQNELSK